MPSSTASPWAGSSQNVSGVKIATPMVADRPGSTPMTIPATTPSREYKNKLVVKISTKAPSNISKPFHPFRAFYLSSQQQYLQYFGEEVIGTYAKSCAKN